MSGLAKCSLGAEVLYWRIRHKADGLGNYRADQLSLANLLQDRAKIDPSVINSVADWVDELVDNGVVSEYVARENKYIHINGFKGEGSHKKIFPFHPGYTPDDVDGYYKTAERVIDYLNNQRKRAGLPGRFRKGLHRSVIVSRLKEGYSEADCKLVVDYMIHEWVGTEWEKYLTPTTLFRPTKFDIRLNNAKLWLMRSKKGRVSGIKYYSASTDYDHIGEVSK